MTYILAIGLIYKKYRKNAKIKIFIDNTLIDFYELDKNVDFYEPSNEECEHLVQSFKYFKPRWFTMKDILVNKGKIPKYIKIVELDESQIGKKLHIEIENDDTNFTNGFMSKFATIDPNFIFLSPKKFLENNGKFYIDFHDKYYKKNSTAGGFKKGSLDPGIEWPIVQYYDLNIDKNNRHNKIDKSLNGSQWYNHNAENYPAMPKIEAQEAYNKWIKLFKQNATFDDPYVCHYANTYPQNIGGSFDISIPIAKKYGIKFLAPYNLRSGYCRISLQTFVFSHLFCNKYT